MSPAKKEKTEVEYVWEYIYTIMYKLA